MSSGPRFLVISCIVTVLALSAQAQILPTSGSQIRVSKKKVIKLNEEEVTANRDWAFLWHWLNNPNHHEYKEEMIKNFKHYTYKEGEITKFKRPFIEGLTPSDETPDKPEHFITRKLLEVDSLAPFFTASQKLYCKDPDNSGDAYCKKGANRREIWEEKTKEQLLEDTDFEQLGTHETFRKANHALIMHQYLDCKDERADFAGESINIARLQDQLINIGNYFNQLTYGEQRIEAKRLRTLTRIQTIVPLDEPPVLSPRPPVRPAENQELPPPPGRQNAAQQLPPRGTKPRIELNLAPASASSSASASETSSPSASDRASPSSEVIKKQTLEFTERLSAMAWPDREKILKGNPLNIFVYYETLTDESRDKLIFEESQFYLKEFVNIKNFLSSTLSGSASKLSAEEAKALGVLKGKITEAILKPSLPKNLPLVTNFIEPSPSAFKELKEWAERVGEELKSVSSGTPHAEDLVAAGNSLKQRVLTLEKARQDYQKARLTQRNITQTKAKLRNEFYLLQEIRTALGLLKTH